jgi:hypothetical protein
MPAGTTGTPIRAKCAMSLSTPGSGTLSRPALPATPSGNNPLGRVADFASRSTARMLRAV